MLPHTAGRDADSACSLRLLSRRTGPAEGRWLAAGVAAGLAAVAGGCWQPGGAWGSEDRFTYDSTPWQPQTVAVYDTSTGQAVWSVDVPVGQRVVMKFVSPAELRNEVYPDVLKWDVWPSSREFGNPEREVRVPSRLTRRIDVTLRPAPEAAPELPPAEVEIRNDSDEATRFDTR